MPQTPQQRRANAKFDKINEKRMGKPESSYKKKEALKPPISKVWLVLLVFVVIAPLAIEPLKALPDLINGLMGMLGLK